MTDGQFLIGALLRDNREKGTDMDATNVVAIGHNQGQIDFAREAMNNISFWLRDNPAIQDAEQARQANDILTTALLTLKDLDDQRKEQVEPLNRQLGAINSVFRAIRVPFEATIDELKRRLTAYVTGEERKRAAEAARLRAEAEAAEQAAREAERVEREAIENATEGECTDVGGAIENADAAFGAFTAAERAASIAEHDTQVRLRSRFSGKARTLRTSEVLEVVNAVAAITAMARDGVLSDKLRDAICFEAKLYRKAHGSLPPGVIGKMVRSL